MSSEYCTTGVVGLEYIQIMLRVAAGIFVGLLAVDSSRMLAADPTIAEQVARLKPGSRIWVEVPTYGPEGGVVMGRGTVVGCLGPVTSEGFRLTGNVLNCDAADSSGRPVRFDEVFSIRPEPRLHKLRSTLRRSLHWFGSN